MKKVFMLVLTILLISTPTYALDSWTKQDIILEATWQSLHFIDYGQTLSIAKNPDRYYEMNPLLGKHPSTELVHVYMLGGALLHPVITYLLPRKVELLGVDFPLRTVWQMISIGMSLGCVVNNASIGLRVEF